MRFLGFVRSVISSVSFRLFHGPNFCAFRAFRGQTKTGWHFPFVSSTFRGLQTTRPDHYATLGLDRRCTTAQIRAAYRLLVKRHHPDVNPDSPDATERAWELNAAHEILSDLEQRRAYDRELEAEKPKAGPQRSGRIERNLAQDVRLRIEDFLRGTTLEVRVNDPANPHGMEIYPLVVPPDTVPDSRFRIPRSGVFTGGFVAVRLRIQPGARFKPRGSDLRCDLRISAQRATKGGMEMITSATGSPLRVQIPAGIGRGEIVRIPGEGLPKRGERRGDLLVKITYRPEVRVVRAGGRDW